MSRSRSGTKAWWVKVKVNYNNEGVKMDSGQTGDE
jgi:hypothetical protein